MKNFGLKTNKLHRIIAATICVVMLLGLVFQVTLFSAPEGEEPKLEQAVTRVADASTINSWQEFYGNEKDTSNAGKIWTDKTVSAGELELVESDLDMVPEEDNFMVGLSALSSSKSVTLEAAIPVDVMFVLDISGSMRSEDKVTNLINSVNESIRNVLDMNQKNRVGVVVYSGTTGMAEVSSENTASCIFPLDRYTSTSEKREFLHANVDKPSNPFIEIDKTVSNSKGESMYREDLFYKIVGNTYIQNGLLAAFEKMVPTTSQNEEGRIPVVTLMSDGAPTTASVNYIERGPSTVGYGEEVDIRMTFLTQLTAAWVKKNLGIRYHVKPLFYTVGMLIELTETENKYARMVINPEETEPDLDNWWKQFLSTDVSQKIYLEAKEKNLEITRLADSLKAEDRHYVDEYFSVASAEELGETFKSLIKKIKIESAELPTEGEENNPNYSGNLVFRDKIGQYMNVEQMVGVMYGGELHQGITFAQKFGQEEGKEGSASIEEKEEFLNSLMQRLNISKEEAERLITNAKEQGQIEYTLSDNESEIKYSNYIAWYADENRKYESPCSDETKETDKPVEAVYKNKSYFYYGNSESTIFGEKLMYLGVRIEENIITHEQTVEFSVPGSLIPMVKYKVLDAVNSEESGAEKDPASPVHLFYEVGLEKEINEYDLSKVSSEYKHQNNDDISKKMEFYDSIWNEQDAETLVEFTISDENEYYYFTEKTPLYIKDENGQLTPYEGAKPSPNDKNTYYYQEIAYNLENEKGISVLEKEVSDQSLIGVIEDENKHWSISPQNFRYDNVMVVGKAEGGNITETSNYVQKPIVQEKKDSNFDETSKDIVVLLGNSGKISIKQGKISVSKIISEENFAPEDDALTKVFDFEIGLKLTEEEKKECPFQNEIIKFSLGKDETEEYWLPAGKTISVKEDKETSKMYKTVMEITQNNSTEKIDGKEIGNLLISTQSELVIRVENTYNRVAEDITLYKIDASRKPLKGAVFKLYRLECEDAQNHNDTIHNNIIDDDNLGCWVYVGEAVSDKTGFLQFTNEGKNVEFTWDTYRLIEEKAPEGYNKPIGQWNMIVVPGGDKNLTFQAIPGEKGEKPPAIEEAENTISIINYKPINPPITGGRGIGRFLILGATVVISGLMITVHLVLQRKRGKL